MHFRLEPGSPLSIASRSCASRTRPSGFTYQPEFWLSNQPKPPMTMRAPSGAEVHKSPPFSLVATSFTDDHVPVIPTRLNPSA